MSEDRLLESTNRLTGVALTESRPHVNAADLREGLRRAKITERVGATDLYHALLRGNGGLYTTPVQFVVDPDGEEYEVDQEVWIYISKTSVDGEATILSTGGSCDGQLFREWGLRY